MSERRNGGLEVFTDGEEVTIRIGVSILASAIKWCSQLEHMNDDGDLVGPEIVDQAEFAKSMVSALLTEQEDGTTPVHVMLDAAAEWCIEQGMEGFGCVDGCDADADEARENAEGPAIGLGSDGYPPPFGPDDFGGSDY